MLGNLVIYAPSLRVMDSAPSIADHPVEIPISRATCQCAASPAARKLVGDEVQTPHRICRRRLRACRAAHLGASFAIWSVAQRQTFLSIQTVQPILAGPITLPQEQHAYLPISTS